MRTQSPSQTSKGKTDKYILINNRITDVRKFEMFRVFLFFFFIISFNFIYLCYYYYHLRGGSGFLVALDWKVEGYTINVAS